ncbi:MAG: DUF3108 domain-containing protein [Chitinivibrionia bacterium]|nr:DUF3108 domain-containing protein [Chitinivibrionia bacterium]
MLSVGMAACLGAFAPSVSQTSGAGIAVGDTAADSNDDTLAFDDSLAAKAVSLTPGFVGFGEGEKLVFSIQYGIVSAGDATMEIKNIAVIDGRPAYHIVSDARSNDVFSLFFKVRDRFESFMDTTRLVSLRYEKHLREGKFKKDEIVHFDHERLLALYNDKELPIHPMTQDVLSALYFVRTLPLEVGQSIAVANHTSGKNYPLVVRVLKKERVTVEAGTFDCIIVEPILHSSGVFKHQGKLTVWLTNDKYRVPVLMKSKVVVGSIAAVLKSYRLADKVR